MRSMILAAVLIAIAVPAQAKGVSSPSHAATGHISQAITTAKKLEAADKADARAEAKLYKLEARQTAAAAKIAAQQQTMRNSPAGLLGRLFGF